MPTPAREENSTIRVSAFAVGTCLVATTLMCFACGACGSSSASPKDVKPSARGEGATGSGRPTWTISAGEAYTRRGGDDDAGCAQYGYVFTDEAPHRISDYVPFALGSAAVPPDAKATLDRVAALLNDPNPKIVRVAVLGYAHAHEDKVLSQGRANAVLGELITRGVPSSRLEAHAVKGELPPGMPRAAAVFEVLVEYRGGVQRWADAGLVACAPNDPSLDCAIPPEAMRTCIRKPQ